MNQEQNNLNPNNFNTQLNNGVPNNQPLQNNQSFNQGMGVNQQPINPQPQPMNNTFESVNASNQSFNSKPPKKMNLGLIIGIVVAVAVVGVGVVFGSKLLSNDANNNSGTLNNEGNNNVSGSNLKYGKTKLDVKDNKENEMNGYGLFKVNNEYIYKGGDYYTNKDLSGNTSKKYEQGYLNNFVKFNNNYWRIIKINEDGTIKLVWAGTYADNKVSNVLNLEIKYVETKTDNFDYENSYLRNYLNSTVLNDTTIIPSNYTDYLVKKTWDISTYDIFGKIVNKQESTFSDYIGVLSVREYEDATYCYKITTGTGYQVEQCENYIANILETAKNTKQLETNTTSIVLDNTNKTVGVSKIGRYNGEFDVVTEYNVDRQLENNVLPVITLKSNISFESGKGTVENPYIIK